MWPYSKGNGTGLHVLRLSPAHSHRRVINGQVASQIYTNIHMSHSYRQWHVGHQVEDACLTSYGIVD